MCNNVFLATSEMQEVNQAGLKFMIVASACGARLSVSKMLTHA